MSSGSIAQFTAYNNFINNPSPENALDFVFSCHNYITVLAAKWHEPNMTRKAKINEIISEMYLILLEDFSSGKSISCQSAFAYLDSKLRRLVNPARPHFFSNIEDVSPNIISSRDKFTFEKINMTKEIVKIIRRNLLEDSFDDSGLVIFLFIHIYPKVRWISELLAKRENISAEDRYNADLKRMNRFNNSLRVHFNSISNGNWREITNWSHSERSHLAWKIINICPEEVDSNTADYLAPLDNWRENFDIHNPQNLNNLAIAEKVYKSMTEAFQKTNINLKVAERTDFWGKSTDIISMLIGDFYKEKMLFEESVSDFSLYDTTPEKNAESDSEFIEIANELNKWFGKLLSERNKRAVQNTLNW